MPAHGRNSTAQALKIDDKVFLIDCADGTQYRMVENKVNHSRLDNIFISHLHGDHCYGLMAVISTLSMKNRTADLHIFSDGRLEGLLQPQIDFFCRRMSYKVIFHGFDPGVSEVIYEKNSLTVTTIPLTHGEKTAGFLFRQKPAAPQLNEEALGPYNPSIEKKQRIKEGADFVTPEGVVIPNASLMQPPTRPKSYAYCSDTMYRERIIPYIEGVDYLYHEATYSDEHADRAKSTKHSTASQAAKIALKAHARRLIIGHFSARYKDPTLLRDQARKIFPNTEVAVDGAKFKW